MDETLALGGNIELTGFKDVDMGSMVIVKKIVGNYTKRLSEACQNFEKVKVTMKAIHETESSQKFEIHGQLVDNGKQFNSETTDRNLFVGIDGALRKLESEVK